MQTFFMKGSIVYSTLVRGKICSASIIEPKLAFGARPSCTICFRQSEPSRAEQSLSLSRSLSGAFFLP
ncbi:uncharacterized protein J3R85_014562 [Psidium guajava]|nr:uncharacterized protein J3R85_014562 [Psidium guajava]